MKEFLKLTQLTEKHRLYSMRFSALNNNIQSQLALDIDDRQDGSDYMGWINSEIDNLLFANPTIPTKIQRNAEKKFPDMYKEFSTPLNFTPGSDKVNCKEVQETNTVSTETVAKETVIDYGESSKVSGPDGATLSGMTVDRTKRNIQRERGIYELNRLSDQA